MGKPGMSLKFAARRAGMAKRFGAFSLVALAFAGANPSSARELTPEAVAKAVEQAGHAYDAGDCRGTLKQVDPILADAGFASLPWPIRVPFLSMGSWCAMQVDDKPRALELATAASRLPEAAGILWQVRFAMAMQLDSYSEAVATLEDMQARDPSLLISPESEIKNNWIFILSGKLAKQDKTSDTRKRFLALTSRADFVPAKTELGYDRMRLSYARLLAQAGNREEAGKMLGLIRNANALRDASLDPDLRAMIPDSFDMRAALENQITVLRAIERERPSLLSVTNEIANTQQTLGDAAASVETLEAARPYGVLEKQFSDREDQINWWWDSLAQAYALLGRYDDVVAAYRQAIAEGEEGLNGQNISQQLNFTFVQRKFGRDQEALDLLDSIDIESGNLASAYGQMTWHLSHGCVAWALGKKEVAALDRSWAEMHEDISYSSLTRLYLCTADDDAAAASFIRRLADPDQRVEALVDLSGYQPPVPTSPTLPEDAALKRVKTRADVQAAIAKAGGVRDFNIPSSY